MLDLPTLHTPRLQLHVLGESYAPAVLDYYWRNRDFHQPWFASRSDRIFTLDQQKNNLAAEHNEFLAGRTLPFWLSLQDDPERIIGRFAFTNIIRGCFHSCFTAYHLDRDCQGTGLAREAGQAALRSIFEDFRLHRAEANIMPANLRSIALAERLGFKLEGLSPRYLQINSRWEDHLHYVRLADDDSTEDETPFLSSGRLIIRPLQFEDIPCVMAYYQRNREHIGDWNPTLPTEPEDGPGWQRIFAASRAAAAAGRQHDLGLFWPDRPRWLAGLVSCQNITPLPFSSCELGYSIDRLLSGRGLMPETLSAIIAWLFARYKLKRITARCVSGNDRSVDLLRLLGFQQEGIDRMGIYLNGEWQHVIRMALLEHEFKSFEK